VIAVSFDDSPYQGENMKTLPIGMSVVTATIIMMNTARDELFEEAEAHRVLCRKKLKEGDYKAAEAHRKMNHMKLKQAQGIDAEIVKKEKQNG
jgi:hypothetical protein